MIETVDRMRLFKIRNRYWIFVVLLSAVTAPMIFADLSQAQTSRQISLKRNFSELLTLPRAAHTIVVGNPKIAAAVVGPVANTVIVTGKKIGSTDLLVLDATGKLFLEASIAVEPGDFSKEYIKVRYPSSQPKADGGSAVVRTFACGPDCDLIELREAPQPGSTIITTKGTMPSGRQYEEERMETKTPAED